MAQSSIITGQYVELTQTPASVGDRLFAAIIDYAVFFVYSMAVFLLILSQMDWLYAVGDVVKIICYVLLFFPVICYYPLCEIFARGQSLGKLLMKTRVVTVDGDTPSVGSCLLRWILYPVDTVLTGWLGVAFIIFGKHRRRIGDLAAGTIVIKLNAASYDFMSLQDYNYVQQGYVPTYPEAASLSIRQADVISRTLYNANPVRRGELLYRLAVQVQELLGVQVSQEHRQADVFLNTILNDFYYYTNTEEFTTPEFRI